jgi:hypothetical protein
MSKATASKAKKSDKTAWIIVMVVGVLGVVVLTLFSTFQFGQVRGDEFSPDTLKRRSYSYYQIPLIRLQVTGIDYTDTTGNLESHWTTAKLVTARTVAKPAWHTIQATAGERELPEGDATILFRYLDHNTAPDGETWLDWSTKKPNAAKILWPAVVQLARDQMYLYVPGLLELAGEADNLAEFTNRVNTYAADSYSQMAGTRHAMQQHAAAVKLYQTALSYQQDHSAAQAGLAEAQREGGDPPAADPAS